MKKKPAKNEPPKKQKPILKAGGELIFQGQDAFTAMCIIDGHLSKVNAARKAAGDPEPLQAYFTSPKQLQDFLLDVFIIPGETTGNRRGNLGFYLDSAKYRTGEDIPWTRSGAIAYMLKAFPHIEFTPSGKALAQDLGVIPDWLKKAATPGKVETKTQGVARATEKREARSVNCGRKPSFLERKEMVHAATESGITSPSRIADVISAFIDKLQEDYDDFKSESETNIRPPEVTRDGDPLSKDMIRSDLRFLKRHGAAGLNQVLIERFKEYLKELEP
jgi:hypothetical protein